MKHIEIAFAFLAIILLTELAASTSEWATTEKGKKYLIENKYEYTWFEALHECAKRNLSLITIDMADKNDDLVKLLKNRFSMGLDLWIGGTASTAQNSNRKFVWVSSGKAFNFANWEALEPNDLLGDQPCVHIWSKTKNFTWADGQWHLKYGYICEETFLSQYHQDLERKRQSINEIAKELNSYFRNKLNRIQQINKAKEVLSEQLYYEIENKFEEMKPLIEHIIEDK